MTDLFNLIPAQEAPEAQVAAPETTAATQSEPSAAPPVTEEIDTEPKAQIAKALPATSAGKSTSFRYAEPPPNPLVLDPYQWEKCTITVGYSLLPDNKVSVSVHNHKDEPIVKEFLAEEVRLPEKISRVMATLQSIWPTNPVIATVVLLPKPESAEERPIITSVRVATDTPIVQEGVESDLPLPAPIMTMLDELRADLPLRLQKNLEKAVKAKTASNAKKPVGKPTATKPSAKASAPAAKKRNDHSDNLTLF